MHDSILAIAGTLEPVISGKSIPLGTSEFATHRAIYTYIDRRNPPELLTQWDFPNPDVPSGKRYLTHRAAAGAVSHEQPDHHREPRASSPSVPPSPRSPPTRTACAHSTSRFFSGHPASRKSSSGIRYGESRPRGDAPEVAANPSPAEQSRREGAQGRPGKKHQGQARRSAPRRRPSPCKPTSPSTPGPNSPTPFSKRTRRCSSTEPENHSPRESREFARMQGERPDGLSLETPFEHGVHRAHRGESRRIS